MTGVYFLADDRVLALSIAFLNSLREKNSDISIALLPFGGGTRGIRKLQKKFKFDIFYDKTIFDECDEIGRKFSPNKVGLFRKLAVWMGPFDRFVYIDVASVVTNNLQIVFPYLAEFDFIASRSNVANDVRVIWRPDVLTTGILNNSQIEYAGSTNFFLSKKGALDFRRSRPLINEAIANSTYMCPGAAERAMINFLLARYELKCSSLTQISSNREIPYFPQEAWAGNQLWYFDKKLNASYDGWKVAVLFIHWGGLWQGTVWMRLADCVLSFFSFGQIRLLPNHRMPLYWVWRRYFKGA